MKSQLKSLIKAIRPVHTKYPLVRVGGQNDGGYLIPDDLEGIKTCFSPGVDVIANFEKDLACRGIYSHLADASVDGAPEQFKILSFEKKFIGPFTAGDYISLDDWVKEKDDGQDDLILQMDIEGAEYQTIISASQETLKRFRIIVVEVHNAQNWFTPMSWDTVQTFMNKLLSNFHVVHLHPNNNCPFIQYDDIFFPSVFEMTLLRKDRAEPDGYCKTFPHPLDQPNVLNKPDRPLPISMYGDAV